MSMRLIVAFDPGVGQAKPGGVCAYDGSQRVIYAAPMPVAGKIVDVPHLVRTIERIKKERDSYLENVVIERQHARPQDSHSSMNVALPAYGQLLGMCQAKEWPVTVVNPKDWKKVVLRGTKRDKEAACAHVALRYPSVDLRPGRRRVPMDGIADAVCIAEWYLRRTNGDHDFF